MIKFRNITPKRNPKVRNASKYTQYKSDLQENFNRKCGYCDDIDYWKDSFYEIDHFVPRVYLKTISENEYNNLVYSCHFCNNAKRAKWPTGEEHIHNNGSEGFIDPCDSSYDEQFYRNESGAIKAQTSLGNYMYRELKLYLMKHEVIWNLERLRNLIRESERILEEKNNQKLKDSLLDLYREQQKFIDGLQERK
jgi:hypothetical protein